MAERHRHLNVAVARIVGRIHFLSFHKGLFILSVAKGDGIGRTEVPVLSIWRIGTALIMAATWIAPGHSAHLGTILNKIITAVCVLLSSIYVVVFFFLSCLLLLLLLLLL